MKQPGCEVGIVHLFIFHLRPGKQKRTNEKPVQDLVGLEIMSSNK